jgi:tetratricopeptide (TPR) repeat protein
VSVLVEAISVVVRKDAVATRYPGGVARLEADCPNATFCADDDLVRVGFMTPDDVRAYVAGLEAEGLVFVRQGACVDMAVVDQHTGPTARCDWLVYLKHAEGFAAAWLKGADPGALRAPRGWTPAESAAFGRVLTLEEVGRLTFVETRGNTDVYRDPATGQRLYVNRGARSAPDRAVLEWLGRAGAAREAGRWGEALRCYDEALRHDPESSYAWSGKGRLLDGIGRPDEALPCLRRAVTCDPRDVDAWHHLGALLGRLGRYREAADAFGRALDLDAGDLGSWLQRGLALERLGDHAGAVASYDALLALDPDDADAWYSRGVSLMCAGRADEAIASYAGCVENEPSHAAAWCNRGGLLVERGKAAEGLACLERAVAIDPGDVYAWYHTAHAARALGDERRWREALEQVVARAGPEHAEVAAATRGELARR